MWQARLIGFANRVKRPWSKIGWYFNVRREIEFGEMLTTPQ